MHIFSIIIILFAITIKKAFEFLFFLECNNITIFTKLIVKLLKKIMVSF